VTERGARRGRRCLALVTEAYGGRGGVAQYNRDFLAALNSIGCFAAITVLTRAAADAVEAPAGIEQRPAQRARAAYVGAALAAGAASDVDAVFCGHVHLAPLAAMIARTRGAKLVVQAHGIEVWGQPGRLRRAAIEQSDLVLAVSRHTRGAVLDGASLAPERVVVVPNTVRDGFTPGDGSALRRELGLEGKTVLLTVSRLDSRERYKGHDRVIAAMPELVRSGFDVIYVVVGSGDDQPRLAAAAQQAGLADRVRFLGEFDSERLAGVYRAADLFVMPSTGEGFGIAFLEAMASGTPALGLNVAGARDALADGALGTLADEGSLGAVMLRLLSEPRRDPASLAAAVRARFGRPVFAANVGAAFARLGFA
jgi:phosphatidyl-myo-inositol dimannoside synthase